MRALIDIFHHRRQYIANCKEAFDQNGNSILGELPWNNISEIIINAMGMYKLEFEVLVTIPKTIQTLCFGHKLEYLESEDVLILYDMTADTRYFFI